MSIEVEFCAQRLAGLLPVVPELADGRFVHCEIQSALLRLEHDMRAPFPVSGKRAWQIVLPILGRHEQPHQESIEAVERLNRQLASAAAARRQPDVVTISFLVVIIEGYCAGWRVRQKTVEKMNWKVARQTAVAEQASSKLVAFGLLQQREITPPYR